MANEAPVHKIYDLSTIGYEQIIAELDAIAKKFVEIKKAKQDAQKAAADTAKSQGEETQAYRDAVKAVNDLKIKEMELRAEKLRLTNEAKASVLARQQEIEQQKVLADAAKTVAAEDKKAAQAKSGLRAIQLAEAREVAAINKEVARREAEERAAKIQAAKNDEKELKRLIAEENAQRKKAAAEEKELNRLIAEEEKQKNKEKEQSDKEYAAMYARLLNEREQQEKQAAQSGLKGIAALRKEISELNAAVIHVDEGSPVQFRGSTLGYDEAIRKLKQLTATEQDFRRQFAKDSTLVGEYTSGIIQAFRRMNIGDLVKGQVSQANTELRRLNEEFLTLRQDLSDIRVTGQGSFDTLTQQLIENRQAALGLERQVGTLHAELRGAGDIGNQITTGISAGFQEATGQIANFILSFAGIQAALDGLYAGVDIQKQISDSTTNLEIELDKTAGGAERLVSALGKLNTRTQLTALLDIANVAAKAGVSEENLLGVTEALDKIKIAFGSDFGDVEQGTEALVKLINVFEGTDQVTGENLLKTGNAVRTLANETVASVPFLNDFATRMAGLKGISNIALPAVLGLASGFEQFGQSSEVAGTALTKVIPKLATDTAKYAEVAHMTQKAFADLLNSDPAEALIRVSEALVKGKTGIEEVSNAFADSELGSGRIAAILGTVGAKADDFRKAIASAGQSYNDTANIEAAFAAKNENLAATLDKISKAFADAANSPAFRLTLTALAGLVLLLVNNLAIIIPALGLFAAGWAVVNAEMIKTRAIAILSDLSFKAQYATIVIGETITKSYAAAVTFLNTAFLRAAASSAILRTAISLLAGPIGIIVAVVSLLALSAVAFGNSVTKTVDKLKDLIRQQAIANEISKKASSVIAEQTSALSGWVAVIKSAASSTDTKRAALQKLIELNPAFRDALQGQAIDLKKLDDVYKQVTESIKANAEAQASAELTAEKQKEVFATTTIRQRLETEFARGTGTLRTIGGFSDAEIDKLFKDIDLRLTSIRKKGDGVIEFQANDFERIKGNLKRQEDAAIGVYNDYVTAQAKTQAKLADIENKAKQTASKNAETVAKGFEVDVTFLKSQIDGLSKQIETFQGAQTELDKLIAKRNVLQAKLDKALGEQKKAATDTKASKLSGSDKDLLAQEDARRDLLLTMERITKIHDTQNLITEETYQRNLLTINQESIDRKLTLIKGEGIAEQKLRADLRLQRVTMEQETNSKIQEIRNKEFNEQQTILRNQLDAEIAAIKQADALVQNDPSKTATERAQSKLKSDQAVLDKYLAFNEAVDKLEKELIQQTTKNSREIVKAQQQTATDIITDRRDVALARIEDIETEGKKEITAQNTNYEKIRNVILSNEQLTSRKRAALLDKLAKAQNVTILTIELKTLERELEAKKALLLKNQITEEAYNEARNAAIKKQGELEEAIRLAQQKRLEELLDRRAKTVEDFVAREAQRGAISVFKNLDEDQQEGAAEMVGQAVSQSFDLASQAMHNYYDAEQQRIQDSLALNLERLDAEKEQVKSRATSQAEMDSIDKQYAAKKRAAQIKAGEEIKKAKRAELKIALVTEIANIAVAANAYPFPFSLAIFGTLSALALGRYALGVGQVNAQQFEQGGQVPKKGGRFGGKPHSQGGTKFVFQDNHYEAEVNELAVIRTKSAPARNKIFQIAGTFDQIASQLNVLGGGVEFAKGAKLKRFATGGQIGGNLQAPVFTQASNSNTLINNNSGITEDQLNKILAKVDETTAATNGRIDRLQVHVNARDITNTQNKIAKNAQVGTL